MATRVLCYGLGPIGLGIMRLVAQRADLEIVSVVDLNPAKVGHDVSELGDGLPSGIVVTDNIAEALVNRPMVALHATESTLQAVSSQLETLATAGINVISTCEELSYPWAIQPDIAAKLDRLARSRGITVLGTGINPGFAMDTLPLLLTAPCAYVRAVRVVRIVDTTQWPSLLQRKVGAGLTLKAFHERMNTESVRHVGLHESLYMLAGSFGWRLAEVDYTIEPVIAHNEIVTPYIHIELGHVAGVRQIVIGRIDGYDCLCLELQMYAGALEPRDEVDIDGDPPIHFQLKGGIHGDVSTAAMVVNAVPTVLQAAPGLATMMDVGVVHWRSAEPLIHGLV